MELADFDMMRRAMVDSQLRTSGVRTPWVLAAMGSLARETFVPDALRSTAYMDRSIALGEGKVLNPPVATALMLQAANVVEEDRVLLIGAPDGYVATLLAERAGQLMASETLGNLSDNGGDFTLVFIDGAVDILPDSLIALAAEGARIVTGVRERGVTSLAIGHVRGGKAALRNFADSEIAPLAEFARKPEFVF